jgi:hypothetical protein
MSFHGPFISHLSYNTTTAPNCPVGTIWTFEGFCVCVADSGCTPTTGTDRSCHQANYAIEQGACDSANQAGFVFTPGKCELRYAFPPSCTACKCGTSAPAFTAADSYTPYQQLADTTTQANLDTVMENAAFPAGATHLYTGLKYVNDTMFRLGSGMRTFNASIPRVLIVVTDGRSNPGFEPAELPTTLQNKVRSPVSCLSLRPEAQSLVSRSDLKILLYLLCSNPSTHHLLAYPLGHYYVFHWCWLILRA